MNMKDVHNILVAGKALIDTPEKWLVGKLSDGETYNDEAATCFCSMGAVIRARHDLKREGLKPSGLDAEAMRLLEKSLPSGAGHCIIRYNDEPSTTHETLMEVWDRAIAKAAALVVVENLQAARAKIEKPENWTQGALARDVSGQAVYAFHKEATCFCSLGAVKVAGEIDILDSRNPHVVFLNTAAKAKGGRNIVDFNDNRKHEEVVALFDDVIQLATEAAQAI